MSSLRDRILLIHRGMRFLLNYVVVAPIHAAHQRYSALDIGSRAIAVTAVPLLAVATGFVMASSPRLLGDTAFHSQMGPATPYFIARGVAPAVRDERFSSGHLCAGDLQAIEPGEYRDDCLAPDGLSRIRRHGAVGWVSTCCTEVIPGSNTGAAAAVRRKMVGAGLPGRVLSLPLAQIVVLLLYGALAVAMGLLCVVAAWVFVQGGATVVAAAVGASSAARGLRIVIQSLAAPRLDPWPSGPVVDLVACQLSDLHQTREDVEPYEITEGLSKTESDVRGSELNRTIDRLLGEALGVNPPALVLSGDLTDTGAEEEWQALEAVLRGHFGEWDGERLMVPGNHDVCLNAREPERGRRGRDHRESLCRRYLEKFGALGFASTQSGHGSTSGFADHFPIFAELTISGRTVHTACLHSNAYRSRWVLSNAVGMFRREQVDLLAAGLSSREGPLLVVTHHHVGLTDSTGGAASNIAVITIDSRYLLEVLRSYSVQSSANRVLVLHGHKHVEIRGMYPDSRVRVFGMPSSTLGQVDSGTLDGTPRFAEVGFGEEGDWCVYTRPLISSRADASGRAPTRSAQPSMGSPA